MAKSYQRIRDKSGKLARNALGQYQYAIRFRISGRGSRQFKRKMWFANDSEAELWIARQKNNPAANENITWDQAYSVYRQIRAKLTPKHLADVADTVKWVKHACGESLKNATLAALSAALREKAAQTSGRSANKFRAHLLAVARVARSEGLIADIPFEHVAAREHKPKTPRKPFKITELPAYMAALNDYCRCLFLALAASGERVTAMANAKKEDIDADGNVLWVIKKGGKRRAIPLTPILTIAISQALGLSPVRHSVRHKSEGHIFTNSHGNPWVNTSFSHELKKAWRRAGLPHIIAHTLRHMVASGMADANMERDIISAALGHEQTATADQYVKAREQQRSAERGLMAWNDALLTHIKAEITPKGGRGYIAKDRE